MLKAKLVRKQKGVILIMVMFILVLATSLLSTMLERQTIAVRSTYNAMGQHQAYLMALSTEALVKGVLKYHYKENKNITHYDQFWYHLDPNRAFRQAIAPIDEVDEEDDSCTRQNDVDLPVPIVNGQFTLTPGIELAPGQKADIVTISIIDMQSRFNVNSILNKQNATDTYQLQRYENLLKTVLLDADGAITEDTVSELVANLETWLSFSAGTNGVYEGLSPAYQESKLPMYDISELQMVAGYQTKFVERPVSEDPNVDLPPVQTTIYEKLLPYLVALPRDAGLNVNTAPFETLRSLRHEYEKTENGKKVTTPNNGPMELSDIEKAQTELCDDNPYDDIEKFRQDLTTNDVLEAVRKDDLQTYSEYFEATISVQYQDYIVRMTSLIKRNFKNGALSTLSRDLSYFQSGKIRTKIQ